MDPARRKFEAGNIRRENVPQAFALLVSLAALAAPPAGWTREPSAAFSPDSKSLALLDGKGTVRIWDVVAGKEGKRSALSLDPNEYVKQVHYMPNGDLAVVLYQYKGFKSGPGWATQGTISACLWNLSFGHRTPFIEVGYGGLAVCPNGTLLAYNSGLWELASGKKLHNVALPKGLVFEIDFAPDGKTVLYRISESLAQDFDLLLLADTASGKNCSRSERSTWRKSAISSSDQSSPVTGSCLRSRKKTSQAFTCGTWRAARPCTAYRSQNRSMWSGSRRTAGHWSHGAVLDYAYGRH
jgi:WD40 repeat protein